MKRLLCAVLLCCVTNTIYASPFVSLKSSEVNMRVGPGTEYPVSWVFLMPDLPMILVAEFNQWRKVRYVDGTEGWVHQNMLSRKNTAIVINDSALLYKYASKSQPIARVEKNVIVRILKKDNGWIKVETHKIKGWMKKEDLWGVNEE
ncbi:MAG: hypothetical protein K6C34_01670 [Alphaproteobacteria bacterium]|nr:hypothetical protein [Alphaproteobacteria bacterium]